jgi:iron complex transport system substrate-binding protein
MVLLWGLLPNSLPAQSPTPVRVRDALDRDVTFPVLPCRIVVCGKGTFMLADYAVLFPEAVERLLTLGEGEQGGGSGSFLALVHPEYGKKIPLDRSAGPEQVVALQPDAVLMRSYMAPKLGRALEALEIPVVYVDFETIPEVERGVTILGDLFGNPGRATELIEIFREWRHRIEHRVETVPVADKPRVLFVYHIERDGAVAFNVPPDHWMQTAIVELAGGIPLWKGVSQGSGWCKVGFEQIAAWDPDVILVGAYWRSLDGIADRLRADPNWALLRAVKTGRFWAVPGDFFSWDQPDPRWLLGLQWAAKRLHPGLFADLDLRREFQAFYHDLFGIAAADITRVIEPRLQGDVELIVASGSIPLPPQPLVRDADQVGP